MWAGDAPPAAPVWQSWLPAVMGVIIAAAVGAAATILVARWKRRLDDASAEKAEAESRKADAETESTLVTTARGMVAEIRSMMTDQRQSYEGQIALLRDQNTAQIDTVKVQHEADMKAVKDRLSGIERAVTSHREWDIAASEILRTVQPGFQPPPPLPFD